MKKILFYLVTITVLSIIGLLIYNYLYTPNISDERVTEALDFCKKHAGKKRYVLYNLSNRKAEYSSVCANGLKRNEYSNIEGSHLSSLGKYKVTPDVGKMRIGEECLILEGLEFTNSNARKREILIHSHKSVYYNPGTYPFNIFHKNLSWGCFVIDKRAFRKTKRISKPMLLWAYH